MTEQQLIVLKEYLEIYNQWKFVGRDKDINNLIADIEDTLINLE